MTRAASPRCGPFDVDKEQALDALRLTWGGSYTVAFDEGPGGDRPRWRAWRGGDGGTMLTGTTPDELNAAIRADCTRGGGA
jgi:hypothetical protein